MTDKLSSENDSVFTDTPSYSENANEEKFLEELSSSKSLEELKEILSKLSDENPVSDTLFKEQFQILLLEDFLPWHKPLGEIYKNAIVICSAKPRKCSEPKSFRSEVFSEVVGCPLPAKFDRITQHHSSRSRNHSLVMSLNEKFHLLPLSQNTGREILSMCNIITTEITQNLPVISICHGKNTKSLVLLGSFKKNNSRLMIKNQGSVTKQELLPRLSSLKEAHLQGFPPPFSAIETSVYAQYEFLESEKDEEDKKSPLNPIKGNSVYMECWWSDVSAVLEPLAAISSSFAKIKAVAGNTKTGAFALYKEIQLIEFLQKGLETGVLSWPASKSDGSLLKRVKEFMNGEKTTVSKTHKFALLPIKFEHFDQAVLKTRKNLDFSDKLWLILKDCSSCEELLEAFTFIFKALGEFLVPPYVFPKNKSTIALTVKRMLEKSLVFPEVNGKSVVEYLLEIGVEKLRRDYVALFLSLELIPIESINYFLQPELCSVEAVTCLKKLHSVLELAIVGVKRLDLSKTLLSEFVRSTLKHYTTVPDIDLSHVFTFEIPAVAARQLLNPMRPTVWEISFLSSVNGYMKQSIHRYVTTPIHEHIYAPDNYHPKLMLKTAAYTYLTATLVQDEMFQD